MLSRLQVEDLGKESAVFESSCRAAACWDGHDTRCFDFFSQKKCAEDFCWVDADMFDVQIKATLGKFH